MEDMQKAIVQMVGSCAEADLITTANPNCAGRVVATAIFSMLYALPNQQRNRIHIHCADGPIDVEYAANHRIYVYGIGDTYDDVRLLYDWHQDTFDEKRSNGAMLATAGLAWRSIGREVLKKYFGCEQDIIDVVLYLVDCWLMADIDAYD